MSGQPADDAGCLPCELVLVRHGQTTWNVGRRLQGQISPGPPLDETGAAQALALGEALRLESFSRIYCSDLQRAADTAAAVATAIGNSVVALPPPTVVALTDLRERRLGTLEGLHIDDARKLEAFAALAARSMHVPIPGGGESLGDLTDRAARTLNNIAARHWGERVLIVTHGGFLRAAFWHATGHSCRNVRNGAIARLLIAPAMEQVPRDGTVWTILQWNVVAHLKAGLPGSFGGDAMSG